MWDIHEHELSVVGDVCNSTWCVGEGVADVHTEPICGLGACLYEDL